MFLKSLRDQMYLIYLVWLAGLAGQTVAQQDYNGNEQDYTEYVNLLYNTHFLALHPRHCPNHSLQPRD